MTVGELKNRMSAAEKQDWLAYIAINGPLQQTLRIEHAIARAAGPFLSKGSFKSLAPWPKEHEKEATLDDLMGVLRAAKIPEPA